MSDLKYIKKNIELSGKIKRRNQIHKRIQNIKKNKENHFPTNLMIMDENFKNN